MCKYLVVGIRRQRQASAPGAQNQRQQAQRFFLNIKKHVFTLRVTKNWHRLPREAVESPLLEILKSHMDAVLGNVLYMALLE